MHRTEPKSLLCCLALGWLGASCGGQSTAMLDVQEDCANHADDDGDGKTDCADPKCFSAPRCNAPGEQDCGNGLDDDASGEADCADATCDGASCGADCVCSGGLPRHAGAGGGGSNGDAGGGGGSTGGGAGTGGGSAGGGGAATGGGTATGGGSAGGSGGGSAGGSGGGSATGGGAGGSGGGSTTGGGSAGGSGGGSATGGGAGGGSSSPCANVWAHPAQATDQQLWDCAVVPGQLGSCFVSTCAGTCACTSYVRSTALCGSGGTCAAPLSGSGCSDSTYYSGPPLQCTGSAVAQSACMLRKLIAQGYCQ